MHQETYISSSPVLAAKTKALFKAELEDEVVKGECIVMWLILRKKGILIQYS